jgi:agmatinase
MANEIKSIINEKEHEKADVIVFSLPYDKTASSHKGTVKGPSAIIDCLDNQIEFFDRKYKVDVTDYIKISHKQLKKLNILSPKKAFEKIRRKARQLVKKGKFIFTLGGEHTVSYGVLDALATKYNPKEVTILQIDAHCDLRNNDSDYSTKPTQYAHSAVMRRASELGYNLVQVGIRTYSKEEFDYFSNIETEQVYISIDVDGFDPSVMPGTGTPVPGGLDWDYGMKLIEKTIERKELIGADIVEVIPQSGNVITEYSAAQLFYSMITEKFKNRFS